MTMTHPFRERKRVAIGCSCRTIIILCIGLAASPVFATEPPERSQRDQARALALKGADAFVVKDYATALERFQRAGALFSAPTITVMEARTLAALGRLKEAADTYEKVEQTALAASAPQAFHQSVTDAKQEGALVRARLASVTLEFDASIQDLSINLDNERLTLASSSSVRLDPGSHTLRATAPGYAALEQTVSLDERQSETIVIALQPLPKPVVSSSSTYLAPARPSKVKSPLVSWAGTAALVAGGSLLAASAGLYVVAWREKHTLDSVCSPTCPAAYAGDIDAFRLHRTLAFVGLGASAVTVATGSYLVWGHRETSHLAAAVGPASVAVTGAF